MNQPEFGELVNLIEDPKQANAGIISQLVQFDTENPPVKDYEVQKYIQDLLNKSDLHSELHFPDFRAVALTSSYGDSNDHHESLITAQQARKFSRVKKMSTTQYGSVKRSWDHETHRRRGEGLYGTIECNKIVLNFPEA